MVEYLTKVGKHCGSSSSWINAIFASYLTLDGVDFKSGAWYHHNNSVRILPRAFRADDVILFFLETLVRNVEKGLGSDIVGRDSEVTKIHVVVVITHFTTASLSRKAA